MACAIRRPPPGACAWRDCGRGFYQSFTNRGVARMCAVEFRPEDDSLYFGFTDGSFLCEGSAIATHAHVHAICEIAPLDNHLIFVTLNAAPDLKGPSVIDGLASTFAADAMPSCAPLLLFRIGLETDDPSIDLRALMPRVTDANDDIEKVAARTGDPFAATQQYAPAEILRGCFRRSASRVPTGRPIMSCACRRAARSRPASRRWAIFQPARRCGRFRRSCAARWVSIRPTRSGSCIPRSAEPPFSPWCTSVQIGAQAPSRSGAKPNAPLRRPMDEIREHPGHQSRGERPCSPRPCSQPPPLPP